MNHGALIVQTPRSVAPARVGDRIEADKVTCVSFFINDTDTDNNKGAAARLLGLKRTTLVEKLKRF